MPTSTTATLHEHHLAKNNNQPRSAVFLLAEEQNARSWLVLRAAQMCSRWRRQLAKLPLPLFDPRSNGKLTWDTLIMLMVLYSAILVPVQVGFPELEFSVMWSNLNTASDVLFWMDVLQNFFVGYYEFDDEEMVRDRARIARRYLSSWFLPDVIGILPIELMAGPEGSSSSINSLKLTRIVRLFRVTKLARLIKLRQFAMKVEDTLDLDAVLTRMTRLIGNVLLVTHILSCLWHLVGHAGGVGDSDTWITISNLEHESAGIRYLYAFYWVVTTLAGVGFGDIHATNTNERMFSIVAEVIGACGFGYLIGNITKILQNWNREKSTRARKLSMVQSFVQKKAIPKSLKTRLLRYFRHYIAKTSAFDERELLCEFSLSLRGEILHETYKNTFFLIPAFQRLSPQFVMDMAMFIKPLIAVKGDVLAKEGSVGTEMFILNSGVVEVKRTPPVVEWIVVLEILTEHGIFGESSLLNYTLHQNTYTAKANCDLYTLPKEDFDRLIEEFPDAEQTLLAYHQERSELYDHVFDQTIARYRVYVKSKTNDPVSAMVGIENIYPTLTVLLDGVLRSYRSVPIHVLRAVALDLSMGVSVFNSVTEKKRMMELLSSESEKTMLEKAARQLMQPINPFSTYKLAWDTLNGMLLLFVVLTIPFEIAFFDEDVEVNYAFEIFLAVIFAIDIVVSFRTAVIDKTGHIVISDRTCWREYLRLWFWIDLLSVLPWTTEHALREVDDKNSSLLPLTITIRMLKLSRVIKLVRTLTRAENMVAVATRHTTTRVLRLIFKVIFIAHLMTCGLLIVSKATTGLSSPARDGAPSSIIVTLPASYNKYEQYILFLYWAITTMTTVGYGDNPPENPAEVAYVALGVLIGASTFTYVVGTLSSLVDEFHRSSDTYRERIDHLKAYLKERMIPKPLSVRLRRYYQYYLMQRDDENEDVILSSLSDNLRSQLVLHLNRDVVSKISFFATQDDACVSYLMSILDPEFCTPGEFVFKEGQVGRHMYFLVKGVAEVLFHAGTSRETIVATLSEGSYFGEIAMLTRSKRAASIRAKTYISLFVLSRTGLDRISLHYPEMASNILLEFRKKITNIKKTSVTQLGSLISEDLKQARVRSGLVNGGSLNELHETLAELETIVGRIVQIYGGGDKGKRKALACVMQHLHKYEFSLDDFLLAAEELSVLRESSSSSIQSLSMSRGNYSGTVLNRLQIQMRRRSSFS
jgi:CRP-like cAMP-binding protein